MYSCLCAFRNAASLWFSFSVAATSEALSFKRKIRAFRTGSRGNLFPLNAPGCNRPGPQDRESASAVPLTRSGRGPSSDETTLPWLFDLKIPQMLTRCVDPVLVETHGQSNKEVSIEMPLACAECAHALIA